MLKLQKWDIPKPKEMAPMLIPLLLTFYFIYPQALGLWDLLSFCFQVHWHNILCLSQISISGSHKCTFRHGSYSPMVLFCRLV